MGVGVGVASIETSAPSEINIFQKHPRQEFHPQQKRYLNRLHVQIFTPLMLILGFQLICIPFARIMFLFHTVNKDHSSTDKIIPSMCFFQRFYFSHLHNFHTFPGLSIAISIPFPNFQVFDTLNVIHV